MGSGQYVDVGWGAVFSDRGVLPSSCSCDTGIARVRGRALDLALFQTWRLIDSIFTSGLTPLLECRWNYNRLAWLANSLSLVYRRRPC